MPSVIVVCLAALLLATGPSVAQAADDATLFRLFFRDGTSVVSYGEFTRVDDEVVFSMPLGGSAQEPRVHVVSLPSFEIDWERTNRYAAVARYQRYAATRGEDDFQLLSTNIARVLNEIALSGDKQQALNSAEQARRTLADWPAAHYGYRQQDVGEVVSLLDEAISDLRASSGMNEFAVSLVATPVETGYEPLLSAPTLREQIDQVFDVVSLTKRSSDRVALLQEALALLVESGDSMTAADTTRLRRLAESQIHAETLLDERYAALSRRLLTSATTAAGQARVADVERVVNQVAKEDKRLGAQRPDMIQSLNASLQLQLDNARRLRLLRDQWQIRRTAYQNYQRVVGSELMQLVKIQPSLEAIRKLTGPAPSTLVTLRSRLAGGADRLQRLTVPPELQATHELLVSAWRFAQTAVNTRYDAVASGNVAVAWEASSSAAGALLMVARVRQDMRTLLDPPHLQ